ncbi:DNA repair protein complementing XP-A cells homolog isoform X2 [Dysidea avara]|uniref:DNA repair protein complementing XP-A cells homolog isoform X2 n=1 Tax=Dysidea avara TaxID=196820 RepID=UPI003320B328
MDLDRAVDDTEIPSLFKMTRAQQERSERNRLKAKALQHSRSSRKHPYTKPSDGRNSNNSSQGSSQQFTDTGGGFILEAEDIDKLTGHVTVAADEGTHTEGVTHAPPLPGEFSVCLECRKKFSMSYLLTHFKYAVCDSCRDKDVHSLITKTDAKQEYLLKDCDLNGRDGDPLPFLKKRNPHKNTWGEMHLYLRPQVEELAHKLWGGADGLSLERQRRNKLRDAAKQKQFTKKITELRQQIEFSVSKPSKSYAPHVHKFPAPGEKGGEVYDADSDTWSKTCSECGHTITFEKM